MGGLGARRFCSFHLRGQQAVPRSCGSEMIRTHLVLLQEDVGHRGKVGQVGLKALHQPAKRSISGRFRERSMGRAKSRTHGPYSTILSGTSLTKSLAILLEYSRDSASRRSERHRGAWKNSRDELDVQSLHASNLVRVETLPDILRRHGLQRRRHRDPARRKRRRPLQRRSGGGGSIRPRRWSR